MYTLMSCLSSPGCCCVPEQQNHLRKCTAACTEMCLAGRVQSNSPVPSGMTLMSTSTCSPTTSRTTLERLPCCTCMYRTTDAHTCKLQPTSLVFCMLCGCDSNDPAENVHQWGSRHGLVAEDRLEMRLVGAYQTCTRDWNHEDLIGGSNQISDSAAQGHTIRKHMQILID